MAAAQPSQEERLAAYVATLRQLKEKRSVRTVLERELLLEFIRLNQSRIDEFPLIEAQQRSISEILILHGSKYPLYTHARSMLTDFVQMLTKYSNAQVHTNTQELAALQPELINLEILLLKCIQGIVYSTTLALDNFSHVIVTYFGEKAYDTIDAILTEEPLGIRFWQRYITHFIGDSVTSAFADMARQEHYTLNREGDLLVLSYAFDQLLAALKSTTTPLHPSRIQQYFTAQSADNAKHGLPLLRLLADKTGQPYTEAELTHISRLICIDPSGKELESVQTRIQSGVEADQTRALGIQTQAMALAVGMTLGLNVMRDDFLQGPDVLDSKTVETLGTLLGPFDIPSLQRVLLFALENRFMALLRLCAGEDSGKMHIRSTYMRRVSEDALQTLRAHGLTRIQRNKIWIPDPDMADMFLFQPTTPQELKNILQLFQLPSALLREIILLWEAALPKISIKVFINLAMLARSTTNLNQKLTEILSRFGIKKT